LSGEVGRLAVDSNRLRGRSDLIRDNRCLLQISPRNEDAMLTIRRECGDDSLPEVAVSSQNDDRSHSTTSMQEAIGNVSCRHQACIAPTEQSVTMTRDPAVERISNETGHDSQQPRE